MHPSLFFMVASPVGVGLAFLFGNVDGPRGSAGPEVPVTEASLWTAVEESDEETAGWLLRQGVAVDVVDADGGTPLMRALDARDPGMADFLLEEGADPAAVDGQGGSVLFHALREGEVSIVKKVLDLGVTAEGETPDGGSLFAYAVAQGRTASARLLLDAGASPQARCAEGRPVSFHAARRAEWLLRALLVQGVDVDARDEAGETLLHAAVRGGVADALPLLWSYGADVNLGNEAGVSPVVMALEQQDHGVLEELLALGADAEGRDKDGRNGLQIALDRRDFSSARLLLDHGARMDGMLHGAVVEGDQELLAFLLEHGADPNKDGEDNPLVAAVCADAPEMALALLEAGATVPEGKAWGGQSLFHLALARQQKEVVRVLLTKGAKVNEPFAEPVQDEFLDRVETEGKIKWYLKKDRRVTPLMMTIDQGDLELVRLMLDYGASKNITTRRYRFWPINFASQRADVPMMQLLLGCDPDNEERWVKLDLSEQRAWVYNMDDEVLFETRVSTGKKGYRTPTGSFVITNKYRHWTSTIYGASMPYFQRLSCGSFGFHQGYVPSYPASHGCLRVPSGNARKLFGLTQVGDRVEIVE